MFVDALERTISKDSLISVESYHAGEKYEVVYSLKSNIPVPIPLKIITTGSDADFKTKGCTEALAAGGKSCELTATFEPATPGDKKLFLEVGLGDELFILIDKIVTVLPAKEKANIEATVHKDLASLIQVGVPQEIEFLFSNKSEVPVEGVNVKITVE